MTADERYEQYFNTRMLFDTRHMAAEQIRAVNSEIRMLMPWLISKRMQLEKYATRVLHSYLRGERSRLHERMKSQGAWDAIAQDAVQLYLDVRLPSDSDAQVRAKIREEMCDDGASLAVVDAAIQNAADSLGDLYSDWERLATTYHILILESVGKFFKMVFKKIKQEDYVEEYRFASHSSSKYSDIDSMLADIVMRREPRLLKTIAKRQDMVKVVNLTKKEFADLKKIIRKDLYENMKGGLGARDIARDILKRFDSIIPDLDKRSRAMLWARTEGAIVQNDALMQYGAEAEMEGKIWRSVGDSRVRDAHAMNDAAGVIPVNEPFPDGSMDAGSGSVSPFNCRCVGGPALLEKTKRERPKTPKPTTTTTPPRITTPKTPKPTPKPKTPTPTPTPTVVVTLPVTPTPPIVPTPTPTPKPVKPKAPRKPRTPRKPT